MGGLRAAGALQDLLDVLVPPRDVGFHREPRLVGLVALDRLHELEGHLLVRQRERTPAADLLGNVEPQPQAGLSVQRPVSTLEGWVAYQQYAPQLLLRAVDSGNPEAYSLAAHLSVNPQYGATVVPRDRIQAAAYRMALMSRASPAYRPTLQRDVDRLNLTEMERTTASLRATELAAKLRPTAAGSIDFTQGVQPDLSGRHCEP